MSDDETLRAYQRDRDAAIERAKRAEAGLAALRAAVRGHQDVAHLWHEEVADAAAFAERSVALIDADARLHAALADAAEAAEAYTRRVRAEALAALREAWATPASEGHGTRMLRLDVAFADTAAAAEAYTRRVRAEALEAAADRIDAGKCRECAAVVRAMADEIRGAR